MITDLVYMKLKEEGTVRNSSVNAKLETEQTILELTGGYRIVKIEDYLSVDGLLGMRYFALKPSLDLDQQNVLAKSMDFINPIIGVRFNTVNGKWLNTARIDIGIGAETTWKFNLLLGYQTSELFFNICRLSSL